MLAKPFALCLALSAPAAAQGVESWSPATGLLPDQVVPAWTFDTGFGPCSAATAALAGGVLRLDHASACNADTATYSMIAGGPSGGLPPVYWLEGRARVVSSSQVDPDRGVTGLALAPPSWCPWLLELDLGELRLSWVTLELLGVVALDTSSAPRTYRLEVDVPGYTSRVFVDGALVLTAAAPTGLGCFTPGVFQQQAVFGNLAPQEGGVSEWGEVRHNLGDGVESFCLPTNPNSLGFAVSVSHTGGRDLASNDTTLHAAGVPVGAFGYFLCSRAYQPGAALPGSQGTLCLGAPVGRFNRAGEILTGSATFTVALPLDLQDLPQPTGGVAAQAGESWHFQLWYRDANPQPTSNLSQALRLTFE